MSEPAFGALAVSVVKWFDRTDRARIPAPLRDCQEVRVRQAVIRKLGRLPRLERITDD